MATHARTVLSTLCYRRCCCVYLGLLVFIRAAFCVNGSFGNLVTNVTSGSSTTASPSGTDIVTYADPINKCVTYTTSLGSSLYIDVGVGRSSDVRTILVYTRKIEPTPVTVPMVLTDGIRYTFTHAFTPFHTDTNTVYVFTGNQRTSHVRVKAADPSASLTVCMMKVYDVPLSEYCTCDDPCSRNTDYICTATNVCTTPATTCHGRNVALNKKTNMSSTYKSDDGSFAVNGNTGTTFSGSGYTNDTTQWNCIHTAERRNPYWQVDLGRRYSVAYLTIYRRGSVPGKERMRNLEVKVDDQLCTTLTDSQREEERIDVTCTTPLSGQVVKLSRDERGYDFLNLCEVQVWECEPGYYGHRCVKECNCSGGKTVCDVLGICTNGCIPGMYGTGCQQSCSEGCADDQCDDQTGHCSCRPGWDPHDLKCSTRCDPDKYGPGCQQSCGEGCVAACDDQTGHCACRPGWVSHQSMCDTRCSGGRYGSGCNLTCGICRHGSVCEHDTGHCQQGCAEGFKGDTCHEMRECSADGWLVGVNAGVTLAVVVVLVMTVLVMTVAIRRYRRKRRHIQRETNEIEMMAAALSADCSAHQSYSVVTADSSVDTGRGSHLYQDADTVRPAPLLESRARDKTNRAEINYDNLQPGTSQTTEEPYDALRIYDGIKSIEDSRKCAVM